MSIVTVGSTNPAFSFVIQKNPATIRESNIPFKRSVRKGVVNGWFTKPDDSEFRLWFKDHDHQSSFAEGLSDEFEYLDRSRYGSPYAPIAIITECLGSASKEESALDLPGSLFESYISSNILVANPSFLERMSSHYNDSCLIKAEPLPGQERYAKITVTAPTLHSAINIFQTLCIMQALSDKETYVPMGEAALQKFAKVFNRANAPYYPRYLFKVRAIHNRATFDKVKEDLQGAGTTFVFGDTRQQRFDVIREQLKVKPSEVLYDIGCGEMFYALRLQNTYETIFAIDADEEISTNNVGKLRGRNIEDVVAIHAMVDKEWVEENGEKFSGADILLTEVLEHIPQEESLVLLDQILKCNPSKVVITVPNKDFNVNYGITENETRHYDHKWEPTFADFSDEMVTVAAATGYKVSVTPIGDVVNDASVSTLAVFIKE